MRALLLLVLMNIAGCGGDPARVEKHTSAVGSLPAASLAPPVSSVMASANAPADKPASQVDVRVDTTVLSRGALGHQAVCSKNRECVLVETNGAKVLPLGNVNGATFDATGKQLYAWGASTGVLYDVSAAKKVAERGIDSIEGAGFSQAGNRIIEVGEGITIVSVPSLMVTFQEMGGHSEVHQTAGRAFTISNEPLPTGVVRYEMRLILIDLGAEKVIGTIRMNEAMAGLPKFAFSADGKKMSWTYGSTKVWDTTTGKIVVLEKGDDPMHPRYEPGPAYFAPDGNSVCIQQSGSIRTISIKNVPKGKKRHCFIVRRALGQWVTGISQGDYEAMIVDVPFTPGTEHPGGHHGLYYRVTTEAMHPERKLVAVIEQSAKATPEDMIDRWLVIAQAATGKVEHRIALPKRPAEIHMFNVSFSESGKTVIAWNGDTNEVVAFDVETGAAVAVPPDFKAPY